ncbi:MarR family transcriptional regulator [Natronorubrum halophilum]|uniref:MarR family transcriptional regulator n=1 Tax=Natronorubrum halophilum TaxID=1702106 RepID=UPI0014850410|nr:helix-turn-helix domain-containing protein [Natronorubrum halophilum]
MSEIADKVSGATTELVEKVLEEYGDPGQPADADYDESEVPDEDPTEFDDEKASDNQTSDESIEHKFDAEESTTDSKRSPSDPGRSTADSEGRESAPSSTSDELDLSDRSTDGGNVDEENMDNAHAEPDVPDPATLTETQRETLRAIYDQPNATQAELATQFDVTGASVSQRVNSIDGFNWVERQSFTEALFGSSEMDEKTTDDGGTEIVPDVSETAAKAEERSTTTDSSTADEASGTRAHTTKSGGVSDRDASRNNSDNETNNRDDRPSNEPAVAEQFATLSARVDQLEQLFADQDQSRSTSRDIEPELAHKVVHACFDSDQISEEEELQILRGVLGTDGN